MTEKRYYMNDNFCFHDRSKGGSDFFNMLTYYEVEDLLNELDTKNQKLECRLKRTESQRNELAEFNVELMEKNKKLDTLSENITKKLECAEPLQTPFHKLNWGDDKGYWRGYVEALKQIQKVIQ